MRFKNLGRKDKQPEQIVNCENCHFFNNFSQIEDLHDKNYFAIFDKILTQINEIKKEDKHFFQNLWANKIQNFSIYENNYLLSVYNI
jgi:hypothetical protein